jgi:histidinol-phosphatase (PHP family)
MILKSIELGLTKICFTEHMEIDYPVSEAAPQDFFLLNTDSYLYDLIKLREKYAGQIAVNFGVEIGLQPHLAKELAKYVKAYDFDFVIASSHLANGKDLYLPGFYEERSDYAAYREYFESILDNVKKFTNFDVYGHFEYAIRYGKTKDRNFDYTEFQDVIGDILTVLVNNGKGLEVNTASLNRRLKEFHPFKAVLKHYRELGGEIVTIGSDAHETAHIARGFDMVADYLKDCGFKYYAVFEKRMASYIAL